jgi:hypothetical protein
MLNGNMHEFLYKIHAHDQNDCYYIYMRTVNADKLFA